MLAAAALAAILFASTDVDDLLVLVVLFADTRLRPAEVIVGQFLGIAALFAVSLALAQTAQFLPREWLGLGGVLPILLGVRALLASEGAERVFQARNGVLAVAATTLANGGDNIGAYTPAFAVHGKGDILVFALVFVAMTGLWLALAHWLVSHRAVNALIRRHGHWAVPVALIGIGVSILYQADSLRLLMPKAA